MQVFSVSFWGIGRYTTITKSSDIWLHMNNIHNYNNFTQINLYMISYEQQKYNYNITKYISSSAVREFGASSQFSFLFSDSCNCQNIKSAFATDYQLQLAYLKILYAFPNILSNVKKFRICCEWSDMSVVHISPTTKLSMADSVI